MIFAAWDKRKKRRRRLRTADATVCDSPQPPSPAEDSEHKVAEEEKERPSTTSDRNNSIWSRIGPKKQLPETPTIERTNTWASTGSSIDINDLSSVKARTRWLPIVSGIICPFSVLLEISGLTSHWYIQTEGENATGAIVQTQPNPGWLIALLAISLTQGVIANAALIGRFLEWRCWGTTVVACIALTLHDILNIVVLVYFGVIHAVDDGYTYGSPYYLAIASTAASVTCNVTLLVDFFRIKDFARNGSGLTPKQRTLVIAIMVLLCYLAIGAIAFSQLIANIEFEAALYFSIVTITSVGFGDIVPVTVGSRIFSFFYDTGGIIMVAFCIKVARETIIESFEKAYRKRRHVMAERARERRRLRKAQAQARKDAIERGELPYSATNGSLEDAAKGGQAEGRMHRFKAKLPKWLVRTKSDEEIKTDKPAAGDAAYQKFKDEVAKEEKREARLKITIALSLFFAFWLIGALIFHYTESWTYFDSLWFCYIFFSTIGYGDYSPKTPAGQAVFIAWSLFGISVMTLLFSVLTERWSDSYSSTISKSKMRSTMHLLNIDKRQASEAVAQAGEQHAVGHSNGEAGQISSIGQNADIGKQLSLAAQDFTLHARYFMNSREGDPPPRLQGLLSLADDEEGLQKLRSEMEHGGSEARGDAKHFLWMISYERSLESLVETSERVSSMLSARQRELEELRDLNAALRQKLEGEFIATSPPRPQLSLMTANLERLRRKASGLRTPDLESAIDHAHDQEEDEQEADHEANEEAIAQEIAHEEDEEAQMLPPMEGVADLSERAARALEAGDDFDMELLRPARTQTSSAFLFSPTSPKVVASPTESPPSRPMPKSPMNRSLTWDVTEKPK